jgi:uncharacterized protein with NRDE domain
MCLLVFAWQVDDDHPLIVGANRDERLERPAHAVCVLEDRDPRILGGRDCLAGGTWLAVNEHGVVAGLTNRPSPGGRDPSKRSRGELPLLAARHKRAEDGAAAVVANVEPGTYNPAWLLVGDRTSLFAVDVGAHQPASLRPLGSGIHVLENVALGEPSPKVDRVRAQLESQARGDASLVGSLPTVLSDHTLPSTSAPETGDSGTDPEVVVRRPETLASCVHTGDYGTRSSAIVLVSGDDLPPSMWVADGPPCTAAFVDVGDLWVG